MFPSLNASFVAVYVPYPNATPAQVQESITKPLEESLATIPNVQRLTSRSGDNNAWVDLNFDWNQDVNWLRACDGFPRGFRGAGRLRITIWT